MSRLGRAVGTVCAITKWTPTTAWNTPYDELDRLGAALQRQSGKPFTRPLDADEAEEKANVRAHMVELGLMKPLGVPRGHD